MSKLVMAILSQETRQVLERWQFDIQPTSIPSSNTTTTTTSSPKTPQEIQMEIQAILRQITASTTFLPILTTPCTFNLLVYADRDAHVPVDWCDSDPLFVKQGKEEQVKLRSFSTGVHQVDAMVAYHLDKDTV